MTHAGDVTVNSVIDRLSPISLQGGFGVVLRHPGPTR